MITKYEKFLESSNDDKYIVRIIKYGKKNYVSRLNKHHSDGYDVVVTSKNPFSDPDVLKMSKETALDIVGKSKGTKAINIKGQIIIEGVTPKTEVQDEIDRLLERKEAEQAKRKTTENWNHRFPQRQVRKIGEATGCMDFDSAERDYHGYEKPLEIATGGHRLRGLDFLIKSRT